MPNLNRNTSSQLLEILATPDVSAIRTAEHNGKSHTVVPVVALVEGVIHSANAASPELALAQEFGRYPAAWDGRPLVMNHPQVDGEFVSANSPEVLEDWSFGTLFNTRVENGKLKTEAWIDTEKVNQVGGELKETIDRIQSGEIVEVSTGLFATVEQSPGTFQGQEYSGIWRSVAPDHLAFLSEGSIGACSVEDGAGAPRLNVLRRHQTTTDEPAAVTAAGITAVETVSVAVEALVPGGHHKKLMDRMNSIVANSIPEDMGSDNVLTLLRAAFEKEGDDLFFIYSFTQDTVVYELWSSMKVFQRSFTIEDDMAVLSNDQREVLMLTRIVAAGSNGSEDSEGDQSVDTTNHQTEETTMPDDVKTQSEDGPEIQDTPIPASDAASAEENSPAVTEPEETSPAVAEPEQPAEPVTAEQYLADAPEEIREVLNEGVRLHEERKGNLVKGLIDNSRCDYTQEELQAMSIRDLEKISKLANVPTYIGQSGPRTHKAPDNSIPPMPEAFPRNAG